MASVLLIFSKGGIQLASLEEIKKEQEGLVVLYERNNSFLDAKILRKSQQLDKMIIAYLNLQINKEMES